MARARDPNRDKAFEIYKQHNGEITNRAIAEILDCPEKSIGGWKSKDKWNDKLNGVLQTNERSTPMKNTEYSNKQKSQQSSSPSQQKERKRGGNPNPQNQFPKRNKAAEKHGFYSKVMPQELQDLFNEIEDSISTTDMLWDQIRIQYLAIMRSQSIMFVESKDEMIKELKKIKPGEFGDEEEWNFQFAWERQAQFLTAQSRAVSELRSLIDQFNATADKVDERRLKLEHMQINIDKSKMDIDLKQKELEILDDKNKDKSVTINFVRKG